MATPYLQLRFDSVPSTQDVARAELGDLPLLVIAAAQTAGRGRSGTEWLTADRAVAASLAFRESPGDPRPFSLMAGVAAMRVTKDTRLKWPNDVLVGESKVGGILVERNDAATVIGLGLNLWWPAPPAGMSGMSQADPGERAHTEVAALWAAELMDIIDSEGWPHDEYRRGCATLSQTITWEPNGSGKAVDIGADGSLVVETASGVERLHSGTVAHVRMS